jgi:hypothetical protein
MHPVPAAKTALKAILSARPAYASVDVLDGQPTEIGDVTRDQFWFEPTEIPSDGWASLGHLRRRITFRLGFTLAIIREGDDERSTEDLLWTLLEDLMAAIKADPSLTNTVQQVEDVTGRQVNEPLDRMWRAMFVGSITCVSRAY